MTNTEEFARLGQAIGDAINRLPDGYTVAVYLARNMSCVLLTGVNGSEIDYEETGLPLADEVKRMIDAAVEDVRRRT